MNKFILILMIIIASMVGQNRDAAARKFRVDDSLTVHQKNVTSFFDNLNSSNELKTGGIEDGTILTGDLTQTVTSTFKQFQPRNIAVYLDDGGTICEFTRSLGTTPDSCRFTWPDFWVSWSNNYTIVSSGSLDFPKDSYAFIYLDYDPNRASGAELPADSVKITNFTTTTIYDEGKIILAISDYGSWTMISPLPSKIHHLDPLGSQANYNPKNQALWMNGGLWGWTGSLGTTPDSSEITWPIFWVGHGKYYTKVNAGSFRVAKTTGQIELYFTYDETAGDNTGIDVNVVIASKGSAVNATFKENVFLIGMYYNGYFYPRSAEIRVEGMISKEEIEDSAIPEVSLVVNNIGANLAKISTTVKKYITKDIGTDSLFVIDIIGSSIHGLNAGALGYPDTTANSPGAWTKLPGDYLIADMQYDDSDLVYYSRSNAIYTYNGSWGGRYGQWATYHAGGKKYKYTFGASAYVEFDISNAKHFAFIYEANTSGDTVIVTFDGVDPGTLSITGTDTIDTYVAASSGADYTQLAHAYFHNLEEDSTYTIRITKTANTSNEFAFWGCFKWSRPSVHLVTTARSGSGGQSELDDLDENVYHIDPDIVINQFHDVNLSPAGLTDSYNLHAAIIDSIDNRDYDQICVISNARYPENTTHRDLAKMMRILCIDKSMPCVDVYGYTIENNIDLDTDLQDGVHPGAVLTEFYSTQYFRILSPQVYGGH